MISCTLEVYDNIEDLYKIFLSEKLKSDRASVEIKKKESLIFKIMAKDPVSMKAFINSILTIIQTYNKVK